MQLVKYEAACRAVADAKTLDEVKEITNRAEAARAYARQAKNRELELDALEIRVRAERRLGEILIDMRGQGVIGQGRGGRPIKLDEIGVDKNTSGGAQRLAKLEPNKFENEIVNWRAAVPNSRRIEVPLQSYRKPSIRGDRQRAAMKFGRKTITDNLLDRYIAPDGRRIADWRAGELNRLRELFNRAIFCIDALVESMPVANPDPLDTMEALFRQEPLDSILSPIWDEVKVHPGKTGIENDNWAQPRTRNCVTCGKEFVLKRNPRTHRPTEGKFCSKHCADKAARKS